MNTIYRIVWNAVTGKWVVASELAKGRKKTSRSLSPALMLTALVGAMSLSAAVSAADANNPGGTVGAGGDNNIAIGAGSYANCGSPAAGFITNPAYVDGCINGVAVGLNASATQGGVAMGDHASTTGFFGTALGAYSSAGSHAIAIGVSAMASGTDSYAAGTNAVASGNGSSAIGYYSKATANNAFAAGSRAEAAGSAAIALGSESSAAGAANIALGQKAHTSGFNSIAMGYNAGAIATYSTSLGGGSSAGMLDADGNLISGTRATAVGTDAKAKTDLSLALGNGAVAGTLNGDGTAAVGAAQVALGYTAQALADRSIAMGAGANVNADAQYGVAIGRTSSVTATGVNSVALGQASVADRANTVSMGNATAQRQVVNMAAGTADTDAVNVSQLKGVTAALGGGAGVAADGSITAPSYKVGSDGTSKDNVGDALAALDKDIATNTTNIAGNTTNISNLVNGKSGMVQQSKAGAELTVGKDTDGTAVNFADNTGKTRTLKSVADGELSATSTEAVNGSQLFATNQNVTALNTRVTKNEADITNIDARVTTNEGDITHLKTQIGSGTVGLVQQAAAGEELTVGKGTDGAAVNFADNTGKARTLKSVADGELSAASTEAVNGSQLFATNQNVTALNTRVTKNEADITNIDARVTTNEGDITHLKTQIGSGTVGLVQQAAPGATLTVGAGTDGLAVDLTNKDGKARQIKGVADGTEDTDAVNLGQLKSSGLIGSDGKLQDAVVYDAGSSRSMITLGGAAGTMLTNVMAGTIAPGSMDAVNGGQLWNMQEQINQLGDRVTNTENSLLLPGNPNPVQPPPGSSESDPHFASNGDADKPATATGVDSVAAGAGASATGNNSTAMGAGANAAGSNSTAIGSGSSASGNNAVAIGAGSVADRDNSVSVGSAGNERQITNVAAGTSRTDAANVGQVQDAVSNMQDWTRSQVDGLSKKLNNVQRQANRGIAASAALVSNMPYLPGKVTLNAGVAGYRGESAMGVGVSRWSENGRFNVNAGVSAARGDAPIFRVGVGVVLGD